MRVKLAGIPVEIKAPAKTVAAYVRDYVVPEEGAAAFSAAGNDILDLHREVAEKMPLHDRLVCHGALIEADGKGILFTAPSGTGKTTHVRLWQKHAGDRMRVINGDKPILAVEETGVTGYGTPWMGKEQMGENFETPLSAVVLLERGETDRILRADPAEYLERLLMQIYLPEDPQASEKTFQLMEQLFTRVPFYVLTCTMNGSAYETAAAALLMDSAERSRHDKDQ